MIPTTGSPRSGERRAHPRAPVVLKLRYQSTEALQTDFTQNLSRGGLFLETDEDFEVGQTVGLRLLCAGLHRPISLDAEVRRVGAQPNAEGQPVRGIGVRFRLDQDADARARVERLVAAAMATDAAPPPATTPLPLRLLHIEPNPHVAQLVREGLASAWSDRLDGAPLELVEVDTGEAALEVLRGGRFHLVMAELDPPLMPGGDLIRRIRSEISPTLPIIATARPHPGDKQAAIAAGADVFLRKPLQLAPLLSTLRVILRLG